VESQTAGFAEGWSAAHESRKTDIAPAGCRHAKAPAHCKQLPESAAAQPKPAPSGRHSADGPRRPRWQPLAAWARTLDRPVVSLNAVVEEPGGRRRNQADECVKRQLASKLATQ